MAPQRTISRAWGAAGVWMVLELAGAGCGGAASRSDGGDEPVAVGRPDVAQAAAPGDAPDAGPALIEPPTDVIELDLANCPEALPTLGEPCDAPPLLCSYGDATIAGCRTYVQCPPGSGVWELSDIPTQCVPPSMDQCPNAPPSGVCRRHESDSVHAPCVFPDGTYCYCSGKAWECLPPPDTDCPRIAPNFGDPCEQQGLGCNYGDPCRSGFVAICRKRYWQPVAIECSE